MKRQVGFLVMLGMAGLAPSVHANFVIAYSVNGGAVKPCANAVSDDNASCFTGGQVIAGSGSTAVTLTNLSGTSSSPGSATFSNQLASTTTISTGSTGATIVLYFAAQNFTLPVTTAATEIDYISSLSITTAKKGSSGSVGLESCVDQNNNTVPSPVGTGFCTKLGATLTNPNLTVSGTAGGPPESNSIEKFFAPLSSTYSLAQMVTLTLGKNTTINLSTSQDLTPVPEPMSVSLLGGVVLVTCGAIRRKRKQEART